MDDPLGFGAVESDEEIIQPPRPRGQGRMTWREGLDIKNYNERECLAAIRGEAIPGRLGLNVTRCCVVRGIRYNPGFAKELHGALPLFTRALNARSIMSNEVPDMENDDEFPYCLWYPETASEETYRQLAARYPRMNYLVGRACAVAGYIELYKELGLLPEVHIAEEARENDNDGSRAIYNMIMESPVKYEVMNDYTRTVAPPAQARVPAFFNGDTAVRWWLDMKQGLSRFGDESWSPLENIYDITEDMNVGTDDEAEVCNRLLDQKHVVANKYLYAPLPLDLPTVYKEILICMAAYYGDVDRYTRLQRPKCGSHFEIRCIIRGIYHNAMFAKWWSLKIDDPNTWKAIALEYSCKIRICRAVNARFIMSNDVSRISEDMDSSHEPYCIWYPNYASCSTYDAVARRNPRMKPQVARVCIVADWEKDFDRIDPEPSASLLAEARASVNPHYLKFLEDKIANGHETEIDASDLHSGWKLENHSRLFLSSGPGVIRRSGPSLSKIQTAFSWMYDGWQCDATDVELNVCTPDRWKTEDRVDLTSSTCKGRNCHNMEYFIIT